MNIWELLLSDDKETQMLCLGLIESNPDKYKKKPYLIEYCYLRGESDYYLKEEYKSVYNKILDVLDKERTQRSKHYHNLIDIFEISSRIIDIKKLLKLQSMS